MHIRVLEKVQVPIYDVRNQLRDYIYGRTKTALYAGEQARLEITDSKALETRKADIRNKLLEGIGGLPPRDTPLRSRTANVVYCDEFRIESILFESRPNTFVTANLYIPDSLETPGGAVIFVCGHRDMAKHDPDYQMVCQHLVRAGLVVLAIDPIGQGERQSYVDAIGHDPLVGAADHEHAGAQCWPLGDGLARYFVHDVMRAIDYLCTRTEVDPKRIGITGNSGGGVQTSLAMICDDRIAAAAPGTFISSRASILHSGMPQDAEQIWPGMAGAGYDHSDILLAFAPRPLMVLAVTHDFFPIDGTRKTVEEVRRFWEMYGKEHDLIIAEDQAHHSYTEYLASCAASFFATYLLNSDDKPLHKDLQLLEPKRLHCTLSGQVKVDYPHARAVYDENIDRLAILEQERGALSPDERILRGKQWLHDQVYSSRYLVEPNPRLCDSWELADHQLSVSSLIWFTQENMMNHAFVFRDASISSTAEPLPISVGLWEGGTSRLEANLDWIAQTCSEGRVVMVLNVTGEGTLEPYSVYSVYGLRERFGTMHKFETDLYGLEDSLAAIRIFDVIRTMRVVRMLKGIDPSDIRLLAKGNFSLYAVMANFLDGGTYQLDIEDGINSIAAIIRSRFYRREQLSALILPGMLRYFDLPDLEKTQSAEA